LLVRVREYPLQLLCVLLQPLVGLVVPELRPLPVLRARHRRGGPGAADVGVAGPA